jgi:hypothetical protein
MTEKEIHDKIGAMHLRFLDEEDKYVKLLNLLEEYKDVTDDYGQDVVSALKDGLKNYERYLRLESALSPRSIIIEKKGDPQTKKIKKSDAEGYYRVVFIMDDGSRHIVHFGRKQTHLLYILFLLCSKKSGLLADFFLFDDRQVTPVLTAIAQLVKMIYPMTPDTVAFQMAKDLSPDHSFSDILQKMKAPLTDCLKKAKAFEDLYWYMPDAENLKKKQLYQMHLPQPNIICPPEFDPIIDALPDAADILLQNGIDIKEHRNLEEDFAYWKQAAEEGDADGLYYMGVYYGTGDVVSQDYSKSVDYFEQAADKGHLDAIFQLGVYHMFGFGVKKDIHKALKLFELAADNNHCEAAAWAGQIYERGEYGVKVNHKKAFNLYMIAAKQDHEEAMWYVIQGYLDGQGTKKDCLQAWDWLQNAVKLGYYKISFLYDVYLFNVGEEYYDDALEYFIDGVNNQIPIAYLMMSKMAIRGYCRTDDSVSETEDWLHQGSLLGDESCIRAIQRAFPLTYEVYKDEYEKPLSMLDLYRNCVSKMDHLSQEGYIQMVDAYRERWQHRYLSEICRQLSIHKPSGKDGNEPTARRRITVRKVKGGNVSYELVLTLANGEEVVVNRINPNSLVLFLLTLICSFKSGYTTMMAKSDVCRPLLRELVRLVFGRQMTDLDNYVDGFMGYEKDEEEKKNEDYYKQYSNMAKVAVKNAVGLRDNVIYFLFDICRMPGRKVIRRANLDPQDILLPQELMELAYRMPDATNVIQRTETECVTPHISE